MNIYKCCVSNAGKDNLMLEYTQLGFDSDLDFYRCPTCNNIFSETEMAEICQKELTAHTNNK